MKLPKRRQHGMTALNLTPLIDVVFNLVIFFLVASHFSQGTPAEGIELPSATRGQVNESPHRLTVTIQADGTYVVDGNPVTTDDIGGMIEQASVLGRDDFWVRIQGDRHVPFELVEPIMLACARNAIENFGFDVIPEETP